MSRRRSLLAIGGLAVMPLAVKRVVAAPPADRTVRIGVLTSGVRSRAERLWEGLADGLRAQGYIEGKNLVIHRYQGEWPDDGMTARAKEFAAMGLDAIVTACGWTTGVAVKTTSTTPIVMATVTNPFGYGFVKSLARPGTNVTGRSGSVADLGPKMLDHMHAVLPSAKRIGALINPRNPVQADRLREAQAAATTMGLVVIPLELPRFPTVEAARDVFRSERVDVVLALPDDDMHYMTHPKILPAADELRIPTVFPKSDVVEGGRGFMSYGPDQYDAFRRSVSFIDRLANGARPEELPVEQPMKLELAINAKKAAEFGIAIPNAAMLRADLVIR
jgi:putative ABC transport system substrate-binding protein